MSSKGCRAIIKKYRCGKDTDNIFCPLHVNKLKRRSRSSKVTIIKPKKVIIKYVSKNRKNIIPNISKKEEEKTPDNTIDTQILKSDDVENFVSDSSPFIGLDYGVCCFCEGPCNPCSQICGNCKRCP